VTPRALREAGSLAGLALIGVALPVAVNAWAGALDVPYSDEFTFRRTALAFQQTGELRLGGWSIMTFVGQLLAVQPFLALSGGAAWGFGVTAAAFSLLAIVAGYALARRFLSPGPAAVAVLMLIAFPGYLVEAPTFMTDIPAMALELLCLGLAAHALDGTKPRIARPRLLLLALLAGVAAFSIREFGLAAPVAVLVAASLATWADGSAGGTRSRLAAIAVAWVATLGACLGLYVFSSKLPGQAPPQLHELTWSDVTYARQAIATTALALSPAMAVAAGGWLRSWLGGLRSADRAAIVGAIVGFVLGVGLYAPELIAAIKGGIPGMIVGNVLSAAGSTGSGAGPGTRPGLFVAPTWKLLNLLALAAVLLGSGVVGALAARAVTRVRVAGLEPLTAWLASPTGLLMTFGGLYLGGTLVFGVVGSLYDRYLWPLILPLGAPLLASGLTPPPPASASSTDASGATPRAIVVASRGLAAVIIAAFLASSVALLLNRAAVDVGRWNTAEALVAAGYPADRVDAGYEWVGDHAARVVVPDHGPAPGERWYHLIVEDYRPCAIVASSSLVEPGIELASVTPAAYRLLLFTGPPAPMYVYRTDEAGCP
jgi:hypothetical protein